MTKTLSNAEHHSQPAQLPERCRGARRRCAPCWPAINDGARADGDPIPVGQAAPLTDFAAADGVEFKNGLTLACEEINALGGILGRPLEPYFEDTKQMGDATNVQAVQRLIDRHSVHAILNGYNIGSGAAIQDVIADAGIIYVHYDTTIGHNNLIKSDPERYFGSFQGDPAEYWYGPGFLKFVQAARGERPVQARQQQDGGHPLGRRLCRQHRQRDQGEGRRLRLGDQPVRDRERADLRMGPDAGQDPPGSAGGHRRHPLPAGRPCAVHGAVRAEPDAAAWSTCSTARRSRPSARSPRKPSNGVLYATVVGALQDEIGTAFETRYKAKFGANAGHNSRRAVL